MHIASEMRLLLLTCRRCKEDDHLLKERLGIAYRQFTIARLLTEGAKVDMPDEGSIFFRYAKNLRYKALEFLVGELIPHLSEINTVPRFAPSRLSEGSEEMRGVC